MTTSALFPRKHILKALGYSQNASRSSWSHDDGQRIFFDAWTNRYDDQGRYPMCTNEAYPRPGKDGTVTVGGVTELARRGHVMWLAHLDLVLAGQREAILINPVPREAGPRQGEKGAKGWIPRYSTGSIVRDADGIWLLPEDIVTVDLDEVLTWPVDRRTRQIERRSNEDEGVQNSAALAKELLEKHLAETRTLLEELA